MVDLFDCRERTRLTEVERGVSRIGRPGNGNWAGRIDLSSRWVEL